MSNSKATSQTPQHKGHKLQHLDTLRCCAVCRQHKPRRQMLRFYKSAKDSQGWQLDEHHLAKLRPQQNCTTKPPQPQGRGAWLCLDKACHHPKKLGRGFRREAGKIASILAERAKQGDVAEAITET